MELLKGVKESNLSFNPKALTLAVLVGLGSLALGSFLERVFTAGFSLDFSYWMRFIPLVLSFLFTVSFLTVLSVTASRIWRAGGYALGVLGFGLPFFIAPQAVSIPLHFTFLLPFVYLVGLLVFNFEARRMTKVYSVFAAWMFSRVYNRFFLFFAIAVGVLVYFSSQVAPDSRFEVPEGVLDPALDIIIERVIGQVGSDLGTEQFGQEQFLEELKTSGLLEVLEQQFGIIIDAEDITSAQDLTEGLKEPLAQQLTADLEGFVEDFLGPYLPFLPLFAAVGAALSMLFLSPVFSILSVGFFGVFYRSLVLVKFARFEEETRQVPVLKVD